MTGPVVFGRPPTIPTREEARAFAERVIGPDRAAERHAEILAILGEILAELRRHGAADQAR